MPGRGQPWKGVGFGNQDRIGSGAIADGSIAEADLDSALQAKVNSGGSGFDPYATEPETYHYFYDEFFYPTPNAGVANWHWEQLGAGTFTVPNGVVGGVIEQASGTTANDASGLRTCAGGLVAVEITKKFKLVWAIQNISTVVNSAQRIGLFAENNAPGGTYPFSSEPNPSIWFAHDGSGNWLAETDDGSTPTSVDTGVAVDLNMHIFEISFDGTTTMTFKIDGATVDTKTANLPTGNLSAGSIIQTGTTANRTQRIDTAVIVNDR